MPKPKYSDLESVDETVYEHDDDGDGDGEYNEAKQAMQHRANANQGDLTNEEIYTIIEEQLRVKRTAGMMKKIIWGLILFVGILSLSNLGTSLAAAILAKDMQASNDAASGSVMRIAATGDIAGAQSTADTYDIQEMTTDELEERRLVVMEEMAANPHSHAHRRNLKTKSGANGETTHDVRSMDEEEFHKIQTKCEGQRIVYLRRTWGEDTKNDPFCGRGTSVVVKEKKTNKKGGRGKNKCKKGKGKETRPDRDVIIKRDDGEITHVTCEGCTCYFGGKTLQGSERDACKIGNDDECANRLFCTDANEKKKKTNNKKEKKNNNARNNNNSVSVGDGSTTPCGASNASGDCSESRTCSGGCGCVPVNINGSDRFKCKMPRNNNRFRSLRGLGNKKKSSFGLCMRVEADNREVIPLKQMRSGSICNAGNPDACSDGNYCRPDNLDEGEVNRGGNGYGTGLGTQASNGDDCTTSQSCTGNHSCLQSNLYGSDRFYCVPNIQPIPYSGVGDCVPTVGLGQTCYSHNDCGGGGIVCGGLGNAFAIGQSYQMSSVCTD